MKIPINFTAIARICLFGSPNRWAGFYTPPKKLGQILQYLTGGIIVGVFLVSFFYK
jgi:hypothetical protein